MELLPTFYLFLSVLIRVLFLLLDRISLLVVGLCLTITSLPPVGLLLRLLILNLLDKARVLHAKEKAFVGVHSSLELALRVRAQSGVRLLVERVRSLAIVICLEAA